MGLKLGAWTIRGISTVAYELNLPIKNSSFSARDVGVLGKATNCSWDSSVVGTNAPSSAADAWYASLAQHYVDNGLQQVKIDCMFNETWCGTLVPRRPAAAALHSSCVAPPLSLQVVRG